MPSSRHDSNRSRNRSRSDISRSRSRSRDRRDSRRHRDRKYDSRGERERRGDRDDRSREKKRDRDSSRRKSSGTKRDRRDSLRSYDDSRRNEKRHKSRSDRDREDDSRDKRNSTGKSEHGSEEKGSSISDKKNEDVVSHGSVGENSKSSSKAPGLDEHTQQKTRAKERDALAIEKWRKEFDEAYPIGAEPEPLIYMPKKFTGISFTDTRYFKQLEKTNPKLKKVLLEERRLIEMQLDHFPTKLLADHCQAELAKFS